MTKVAAMPIYGKNSLKFFSLTNGPISTKLGMKHRELKYYNVFINYDLWMTLTYFTFVPAMLLGANLATPGGSIVSIDLQWEKLQKSSSLKPQDPELLYLVCNNVC